MEQEHQEQPISITTRASRLPLALCSRPARNWADKGEGIYSAVLQVEVTATQDEIKKASVLPQLRRQCGTRAWRARRVADPA